MAPSATRISPEGVTHPVPGASWSLSSEVSVLGGVLVATREDREVVAQLLGDLDPDAFFREGHRVIWRAMQALGLDGGSIDLVTVSDLLERQGDLEGAGGLEYLAELLDAVPTAANIRSHARLVRESQDRRRAEAFGQELSRVAGSVSMAELRATLQRGTELLGGSGLGPPGRSAREILDDPETALVPDPLAVPFAYRGRLTVLSAREKVGKTTLAVAAMAAVTRGRSWAGERTRRAPVAWWPGPTESTPGDVASLFQTFGGDPGHFFVVEEGGEPFGLLERALEAWDPAILVVDSLSAVARGLDLESGDARGWHLVMARLGELARRHEAAVVVIHHGRKEDGSYRDSTAIGAGADVLVSIRETEVDGERELRAVGRWKIPSVTLRLVEPAEGPSRFEPVGDGISLDARVLIYLEQHPGASTRAIRNDVLGRTAEIGAALDRLADRGAIEDRGTGGRREWHVSAPGSRPGTAVEPPRNRGRNTQPGEGEGEWFPGKEGSTTYPPFPEPPPGPPATGGTVCAAGCGAPVGRAGIVCATCKSGKGSGPLGVGS